MLYIFHGPDDFTRNEAISALKAEMGDPSLADLNITVLEGQETTLGEIRHNADSMPFMADKRLVIVNGYINAIKGKSSELEALVDYVANLPATTDLVLAEIDVLDKRSPLLKVATEVNAVITPFGGPNRNDLRGWIINRVKENGAEIDSGAAQLLGQLVGTELRTLNNEIEKLALYVGDQRPIQRQDVELLVPYTEDAEDFGLANAIGQQNAQKAYDQLHKMLDEGKHPMAVLGSIATQIRGLLEVKDMAERGMSPQEIAEKKNWRSDYAAKMRLREAARFSAARLEEILELLLEIDLSIKTGQVDSLLALDQLLARLCAVR